MRYFTFPWNDNPQDNNAMRLAKSKTDEKRICGHMAAGARSHYALLWTLMPNIPKMLDFLERVPLDSGNSSRV